MENLLMPALSVMRFGLILMFVTLFLSLVNLHPRLRRKSFGIGLLIAELVGLLLCSAWPGVSTLRWIGEELELHFHGVVFFDEKLDLLTFIFLLIAVLFGFLATLTFGSKWSVRLLSFMALAIFIGALCTLNYLPTFLSDASLKWEWLQQFIEYLTLFIDPVVPLALLLAIRWSDKSAEPAAKLP